jgi:hypothetical protein
MQAGKFTVKKQPSQYKKRIEYTDHIYAKKDGGSGQRPADYAKTLLDPWLDLNTRIPDLACFPTATYKNEINYVWKVHCSTGVVDNTFLIVDFAETMGYYHCNGHTAAAPGSYTGGALASSNIGLPNADQFHDKFRLVSAGVKVKFADADTHSKGVIWSAVFPGTSESIQLNAASQSSPWTPVSAGQPLDLSTYTALNQLKGVYTGPLVDGCVARYQPSSSMSFAMIKPGASNTINQVFNYGRIVIYIDGLTAGDTRTLHVSFVANIEAIPLSSNSSQIATAPSPASANALDAGLMAASSAYNSFSGTDADWKANVQNPVRYLGS